MEFALEPLVSELFNGLFKLLGSSEVRDFARNLVGGVDSELDKLKRLLQMVQDLLSDAEEKNLNNNPAVKRWLDDLQDWSYDAEDILDEFTYKALQRKLKEEDQASSSKGLNCLPSCFTSPFFNVHMESKIKDITSSFEELCKLRTELGLQANSAGTSRTTLLTRPQQSSSVQPENFVYGRDEDEAKLVEMAVKSDQPTGANFRVIVIVGMGGIGKTTMARKVYNEQQREDFKFEEKAWVCVSDNFDVLTISKNILGLLKHSSSSNQNNLNEAQVELQKIVNGKKFLIVLDDIWEVDYSKWEQLVSPFKAGAPGSTMIVTTRNENVAKAIRCPDSDTYPLGSLSDEACWSLFREHALATGTAADADLILAKEKVVKRCSGLPLAAKTLGGLLHSKPVSTWERMLDSDIWNSFKENDVLPVLKLSYLYLPSHLKRCFAYCAIFPEDYEFEEKELVLLWMAEGIVQPSLEELDETGQYFNDLCLRSLFQKSSNDGSKYIMHDLVHDLAESVFKEFSFRSEQAIIELPENVKRTRHFSYLSDEYDLEKKFKGLEKLKGLRTLLPVYGSNYSDHYMTATVLFDLLPKIKKLRVLSLKRYYITHLPDSIGDLIHLRYLNFSYTRIKSLPESTSELFNLQTLLLKDCSCLGKLPCNMRYLTNLYHLDISGQNSLNEMPSRMKELKNLRMLTNFIVGKEVSSNLEDLKSLGFLQGELHISKLENVTDPNQTGGQILSNKDNLKALLLEWGDKLSEDSRKGDVEHVLGKLKPPSSLAKLTIKCYGGQSFPSNWFIDPPSLSNLVVLKLENCEKCKSLPSIEMLSSLKDLTIEGMASLERIDFQMPLKSLEVLRFRNLQEWEHWNTWKGNEDVERLAQLRELCIEACPKLTGEFPDHLPSLERFFTWDCSKLVVSVSSLPKKCKVDFGLFNKGVVCDDSSINFERLDSPRLSNIPEAESKLKQGSQRVESLMIDGSDEIVDSWQNLPDFERSSIQGGMHGLTFLKELHISNCRSDFAVFENTNFLPNLGGLTLNTCQTLISLPGGLKQKNLETLRILKCDSLRSIDCSMLPSSLKKLEIDFCDKLEFLKDISTSLLEYLRIAQCYSLSCTSPHQLPETLQELYISDCNELKTLSRYQYLPEALTTLSIQHCRELKSIDGSFEKSTCLQKISLVNCENLESIPLGLQYLARADYLWISECPKLLVREGVPTSLIVLGLVGGLEFDKPMMQWELHNLRHFTIWKCEDAGPILQVVKGMLTSLTTLTIKECPRIKSIPNLTSLTSLTEFTISKCPMLKSIPNLSSLTSLRFLFISECERLEAIPALGSLEEFQITKCHKLKSLQSLPSSLPYLGVSDCPLLTRQWKRGKRRYCSKIAHIPKVLIDGKFIFNSKEEETDNPSEPSHYLI